MACHDLASLRATGERNPRRLAAGPSVSSCGPPLPWPLSSETEERGTDFFGAGYPGWRSFLADPGLPSGTPSEFCRWRALRAPMLLRRSGAGCRGPSRTGLHEAAISRAVLAGGLKGAPTQQASDAPRSRSYALANRPCQGILFMSQKWTVWRNEGCWAAGGRNSATQAGWDAGVAREA